MMYLVRWTLINGITRSSVVVALSAEHAVERAEGFMPREELTALASPCVATLLP